jgi:predicted dehydrogenase
MKKLLRRLPTGLKRFARRLAGRASVPSAPSFTTTRPPEGVAALRCGIIGLGVMGNNHAEVLRQHPCFSLAAVTSTQPQKQKAAENLGAHWFDSADQLIQSGAADVIVIATPHWHHAEPAVKALGAGLHVVCEKPLTVATAQADVVLRAASRSRGLLTAVFQSRFEPVYQRVKALLDSGEMGPIRRCEMVETFWRSDAYYRSRPWRATWRGEGGGVLLNQAPHTLDRYSWLFGRPESVTGFCDTALHPIEVEDTASAVFRHPGGMHGYLHVNTNDNPAISRTVIACDRGQITIENGTVCVRKLRGSVRAHTAAAANYFGDLESESRVWSGTLLDSMPELLGRFYTNFAFAAAGREALGVTGEDAAHAVELSNAILLSSATSRAVRLPLDRGEYDAFVASKIGGTT